MRGSAAHEELAGAGVLALGVLLAAAFLLAILAAVGGGFVAHAELQQAADLAATSVERLPGDSPLLRARRIARANGAQTVQVDPVDGGSRLRIRVTGRAPAAFGLRQGATITATAWAALPPPIATGDMGPNPRGVYSGPLELAGRVPVCPVVAAAFRSMDQAARADGVRLVATSGFRTIAEQATLYARLGPGIAAPPGASRHHDATELDIAVGPAGSAPHRWLQAHAPAFGFIQRYSWEPWHWGYTQGCERIGV
jgi:hypothetical protein